MTLQQLEEANSPMCELPNELSILRETTTIHMENFKNEITTFCNRVRKLKEQFDIVDDSQLYDLKSFVQTAFKKIHLLEQTEKNITNWKTRLTEHFCEDPSLFKLEDCFNILGKFCEKIKTCLQENQERRYLELRRSSSVRNPRKFSSLGQADIKDPNRRVSSFNYGRSGVHEFGSKMASDELIKSCGVSSMTEFKENGDLDEYAKSNEMNFFRRSSIRMSRKPKTKSIIPGMVTIEIIFLF